MRRLFGLLLLGLAFLSPSCLPPIHHAAFTQQDPQTQTIYVTKTGKRYHRDGCQYLRRSRIPISLKDAKANGYTPCLICRPPQ